jgi:hypothetical protein
VLEWHRNEKISTTLWARIHLLSAALKRISLLRGWHLHDVPCFSRDWNVSRKNKNKNKIQVRRSLANAHDWTKFNNWNFTSKLFSRNQERGACSMSIQPTSGWSCRPRRLCCNLGRIEFFLKLLLLFFYFFIFFLKHFNPTEVAAAMLQPRSDWIFFE